MHLSGTLLLELARLKINENEKVKEFNQRFIVKRKEMRTLEENFEEAIQIEELASISTHQENEESEASTS